MRRRRIRRDEYGEIIKDEEETTGESEQEREERENRRFREEQGIW